MPVTLWPLANSSSSTRGTFPFYTLKFPPPATLLLASKPSSFYSPLLRNPPSPPSPAPRLANSFRIQPRCTFFSVLSYTLHLDLIPVLIILCHNPSFPFLLLFTRRSKGLDFTWGLDFHFIHHYSPPFIWPCLVYSWYLVGISVFAEWMNTRVR